MVLPADKNLIGDLLLEMALEAESCIALREHALIHGAMRLVANETALARRFVFVNVRASLDSVTLKAGLILSHERSAAGNDGVTLVRVVAIRTTHFAFEHGMMVWQVELASLVQMAVEASFRRFFRINDRGPRAAGFVVDAAWAVTGFTTHVEGVRAFRHELGVRGGWEIARDVLVALRTALRADERGAGDLGWRDDRPGEGCAGDQDDCRDDCRASDSYPARRSF